MVHLEHFKSQCKIYAGCLGGGAALFGLLAGFLYSDYMRGVDRANSASFLYDMPDPGNFQALLGVTEAFLAAAGVALLALVAANLLIAYRRDVLASQGDGDWQES